MHPVPGVTKKDTYLFFIYQNLFLVITIMYLFAFARKIEVLTTNYEVNMHISYLFGQNFLVLFFFLTGILQPPELGRAIQIRSK
jgi:hypothetical protein